MVTKTRTDRAAWGFAQGILHIGNRRNAAARLATILMVLGGVLGAVSAPAYAFDVDGFRTFESLSDVTAAVDGQGWKFFPNRTVAGAYLEARYDESGKASEVGPASFTFCNGRLIAYSRSIDFDTEYPAKLRELIGVYGNQPRISVTQDPWSGPGGGYVFAISTQWFNGPDRIDLGFVPESHTGDGALKNRRAASIGYVHPDKCRTP